MSLLRMWWLLLTLTSSRRKFRIVMDVAWCDQPVFVLGGPNLGRLGRREPGVYGAGTYEQLESLCVSTAQSLGLRVDVRQTDVESQMLGWLHEAADAGSAVVLNPAAWTHTSVALRDAAVQVQAPLVEVHVSNVFGREEFRHTSFISGIATGVITGLGFGGYVAALRWLADARDGQLGAHV